MSIIFFAIFVIQTLNNKTMTYKYIITTVEDDRVNDLLNVKSELVVTDEPRKYIESKIRSIMSKGILPVTCEPVFFANTFDNTYENNRIKTDSVNVCFSRECEFGDDTEIDGRVSIFAQHIF